MQVGNVLLLWLSELTEPIIPNRTQQQLLSSDVGSSTCVTKLREALLEVRGLVTLSNLAKWALLLCNN